MRKVKLEELFPDEVRAALAERPLAYVPIGQLERHGPHCAIGLDGLKAHELCVRCAERTGGVVVPPTFWSVGEWTNDETVGDLEPETIDSLYYQVFRGLKQLGAKAVVALTGHYPQNQIATLKSAAGRFQADHGIRVLALGENELTQDIGYLKDHAGRWETSLLMYLRPELVDMGRLAPYDITTEEGRRAARVWDPETKEASCPELGEKVTALVVERLSAKALELLGG